MKLTILYYNSNREGENFEKRVSQMEDIKETPLCKLAYKYGTDKCPRIKHNFTPYYYKYLSGKKKSTKKVVEMGIGVYRNMKYKDETYDRRLKRRYIKGASLKMWRDFFPNAQIYGVDIEPDAMFKDKRIKTLLCDERKEEDIKKLIKKIGSDIDLFIDDGSHRKNHQVFLAKTVLPLLKKNVIYIIEDVTYPRYISVLLKKYDCEVIECSKRWKDDKLVVVKNK